MRSTIFIFILIILNSAVFAEVPQMINYQGRLMDDTGEPVTNTNPGVEMIFTIYNHEVASDPVNIEWTSGSHFVKVEQGLFTYLLGSNVSLLDNLFASDTVRWLGIKIGADSEIDPRTKITSVPYAYHALRSDTADVALFDGNSGWVDDGTVVRLNNVNDSVGIGTFTPSEKLDVNGTIHANISNSELGASITGIIAEASVDGDVGYSYGVRGIAQASSNAIGACGISGEALGDGTLNIGVRGRAYSGITQIGISGEAGGDETGPDEAIGVRGFAAGLTDYPKYGVYGSAGGNSSEEKYGVYGLAHFPGPVNYGVYGHANGGSINWAGYFDGDVGVTGDVGVGTDSPQGALDVNSTTGAFIVPRMTTEQRDALSAINGMIVYNTSTNQFNFHENGAWVTK